MEALNGGVRAQQRLNALARANQLRAARAGLKRQIASGEVNCAELILRPRWEIERMPIAQLLTTQRSWGEQRCRTFLRRMKISATRPIGSISERERQIIAEALRPREADRNAAGTATSGQSRPTVAARPLRQ